MTLADSSTDDERCCHDTARHRELHRCLDELVACWITEHSGIPLHDPDRVAAPKLPSNCTIMELMVWSARKAAAERTP